MPFPESAREVYSSNPLVQVVCQVSFPDILEISTDIPAKFQSGIRQRYPLYEEQTAPEGALSSIKLPSEIAEILATMPFQSIGQSPEYRFSVEDKARSIVLTQGFIAITERQYSQWKCFREEITLAEGVLKNVYAPSFYNRVGLRYIDVLTRDNFGLSETPWSELLNQSFIGILGDEDLATDIQELQVDVVLSVPDVDQGQVHIRHGLARAQPSGEETYLIDADFYTDRRCNSDEAFDSLDKFNRWGSRLFRWATSRKLRDALGPIEVKNG
jgi:uncharacterized protein (TIGR04255 family)